MYSTSKQRNEEECKKDEIHSVGNAAADHSGHHFRLLRFLFPVSYIASDGPHSIHKRTELLSKRLSDRGCSTLQGNYREREKILRLWTMKKDRRKRNLNDS